MANFNKKELRENLQDQIQKMFNSQEPAEMEDILFEVFEDANIPNLPEETITKRAQLHWHLRKLLRTISQNPEFLKQYNGNSIFLQK